MEDTATISNLGGKTQILALPRKLRKIATIGNLKTVDSVATIM
jgi:hypothetical protein